VRLGERIYKLRTENEMSQGDLAEALKVSRQSLSKWETNGSVPELDKLVKLSEVFGVSLDELIIGKKQEMHHGAPMEESIHKAPAQAEAKIIYIEKPARQGFRPSLIFGIILLFCSLSAFLLFACLGEKLGIGEAIMLCIPVALSGILCLVTRHPLLWSSWCGSVTWWVYMFVFAHRWEAQTLFLLVGCLLVIASLVYTIHLQKHEQIHIPTWGWVLLIFVLILAALLLAVNLFPLPFETIDLTTPVVPIPDASVSLQCYFLLLVATAVQFYNCGIIILKGRVLIA